MVFNFFENEHGFLRAQTNKKVTEIKLLLKKVTKNNKKILTN